MLEEKLDLLTKEIVALRKSVEENTAAGGATAGTKGAAASSGDGEDKPAGKRGRGRPPKEEAPEPTHDKDEVEEIVRKVSREVGKPAAVKIIKSFKCDDLADLLSHPEHFDAAFDAAEAALDSGSGDENDDDI
jgi:hypothetical protein